jgi:hypothetical protein
MEDPKNSNPHRKVNRFCRMDRLLRATKGAFTHQGSGRSTQSSSRVASEMSVNPPAYQGPASSSTSLKHPHQGILARTEE